MSDTTAYVAGCATTGVAILVLLVARGAGSTDRAVQTTPEPVETAPTVPVPDVPTVEPEWEDEMRRDLERQRELTSRLESQLAQQEAIAENLENQLQQQQEETRAALSRLSEYQQSVDTSIREDQLAKDRQEEGFQTTLLWIGGGVVVVLILGGGALILGVIYLAASQQRRPHQPMSVVYPLQMPTPPSYRYYQQEFLPQQSRRAQPPPYPGREYDYDA